MNYLKNKAGEGKKKKQTTAILAQNFRQHFAFYIFFSVRVSHADLFIEL